MTIPRDRILRGDAVEVLKKLPKSSVDLVLTSPPYFQLRDYGVHGQLGLEQTPEEYIEKLVAICRELHRVLKDTGSLFLNLGDSYRGKSLLAVPWRVALSLIEDGWLLRNAVIWHKPNALPRPIKDRLTTTYEFVFHFTKTRTYYYDLDAIRVPHKGTYREGTPTRRPRKSGGGHLGRLAGPQIGGNFRPHPKGKNPGDVWTITPETRAKRFIAPGTPHFAPFPETICERPILAACPPHGIVLDPFMGSGTTAVVARRLGRHFLGIELAPEYVALARRRIAEAARAHPATCSCRLLPTRSRRRTANSRLGRGKARRRVPSFYEEGRGEV